MTTRGTLRLATRGSDLALRQAAAVRDALADRRFEVELVEVETRGDRLRDELLSRLGTVGAFVRALDERVLDGEVDAAVHSLKDVPTEVPDGIEIAGVPARAAAGDVLVTPDGTRLAELPAGATVGTSSLRRRAQVLAQRPDLTVEPVRGNVETRVEKLLAPTLQREHERRLAAADVDHGDGDGGRDDRGDDGTGAAADDDDPDPGADDHDVDPDEFETSYEAWLDGLSRVEQDALGRRVDVEYDALVMAEAGLDRAGLLDGLAVERLDRASATPAAGQGAVAVTARGGGTADAIREVLDDPVTRVTTTVERTVLGELGGGCVAPIGVNARVRGEYVDVRAQVFDPDPEPGTAPEVVADTRELPVGRHADAAVDFAADLADRGAAALVAAARDAADDAGRSPDVHGADADGDEDANVNANANADDATPGAGGDDGA